MSRARAGRARRSTEPPGAEEALEIAARFLSVRPRSEWEVEQRLQRAKASPGIITVTIGKLRELELLDDLTFARWWLEQRDRHAPRGHRMIEAELRQHRIAHEVIEQLRDEMSSEVGDEGDEDAAMPLTEEQRAERALHQHLRGRALPDEPKAVQRIGMFLVRRGFAPDVVRSTLRSFGAESGSADR